MLQLLTSWLLPQRQLSFLSRVMVSSIHALMNLSPPPSTGCVRRFTASLHTVKCVRYFVTTTRMCTPHHSEPTYWSFMCQPHLAGGYRDSYYYSSLVTTQVPGCVRRITASLHTGCDSLIKGRQTVTWIVCRSCVRQPDIRRHTGRVCLSLI